ncbi:TIR domain-containing protein [Erythrobacter litoralis]|uniref:Putative adenylate cyclase protein n=1 Tax=Erythrobacter litoralis (strain HTCC2594) TaxID=314225 RepID=Q2NDU5_ERYLH|nr:TIR domain-containing protein [Erythrobacter litoralis]ABC62146.1 putative adenylate cyclase protein [Erythrobacter litoralis HTCC2594]
MEPTDDKSGESIPAQEAPWAFVSYSREDRPAALKVIEALKAAGIAVWWDGLLEGGARYNEITEDRLENAYAVIVLWSHASTKSHWVHDEAMRGRDRHCLVPASIDGSEPPLGFRQFQCVTLASKPGPLDPAGLADLVQTVQRMHPDSREGTAAHFVSHPAPSPDTGRFSVDRRLAIGGGIAALAGVGGLAAWQFGVFGGTRSNSIAVLPFETIGGGEDQTWFADGLAAEIRARLAQNPLLKVAAKASSNTFRETEADAKEIASKLKVAFLLNGDVRREGDQLRVTAALTDGSTGFTERQLSFDRAIDGVFEIQSAIAAAVIAELTAQIEGRNTGEQIGGTDNVAAYEAFLRGNELFDAGTDQNTDRQALAKFEEAVAIDPGYAAAHAGKSRAISVIGNLYTAPENRAEVYGSAAEAAREAVRLAPEFADGHSALGFAFANRLDMQAARDPYERSYQLGAGDAEILSRYAKFRSRIGDADGASAAIERAVGLDPLNARVFVFYGNIAYAAGRYAEAIDHFDEARALQPQLSSYHYSKGLAQLELGDFEAARDSFAADPFFVWQKTGGAIVEHKLGNTAAAKAHYQALKAEYGDESSYQYVQILSQWGDIEGALAALGEAERLRDSGLVWLYYDPLLAPIRETDEYRALIKRFGFV